MSYEIAYRIQKEQGWTEAQLADILLDYISNQGDDAALEDYLSTIAHKRLSS